MARWALIRDVGTWVAGLLVLAHEVVAREDERPYVLILVAGLLGLPVFLRQDGRSNPPSPPVPTQAQDHGTS
jgi:hypothetical protein